MMDNTIDLAQPGFGKPAVDNTVQPFGKWLFDMVGAVILLVPLLAVAMALLLLNPLFNKGSLFFVQDRMGYRGRRFRAFKFRSMTDATPVRRGAFDALEEDRITPLGRLIRKTRMDELPQVINVLLGQMSLIGPRPDAFAHASVYVRDVAGYRARLNVLPGISGFAQTEVGYVDGLPGLRRKVQADLYYINRRSMALDLWILWRTLAVVAGRQGA